jgi:GNAT superfamily N-acetyltransferase
VVPGASVSVNALLSQLEREPGEFIVDPWVRERVTLVAEQRQRIVAAAHLLRYAADGEVGACYRDAGEIRWFLFWPAAPCVSACWPGESEAASRLMVACVAQLERWAVARLYADGALPHPGVHGVPQQWPHVRAAYEQAGFTHEGRTEIVFLAHLDELARSGRGTSLDGLSLRRSVGVNGTRLAALHRDGIAGFIEVAAHETAVRLPRQGGLAEIGDLHVGERYRRHGVASWLLDQAAYWLRLGGIDRLLASALPDQTDHTAWLASVGFRELTRTARGWERHRRNG